MSQTSFGHISISSLTIPTVLTTPESPWKYLSINTSHIPKQSVMAEILGRSTGSERYRQGNECVLMNLNNQQDNAWSPKKMSQYINVKMSIYTPEVRTKWAELQLNGKYIYIWLKRISMTNSKFSWWNGGETETSCRAGYWRNSKLVSNCTLQYSHSMRDLDDSKSFTKFFECLTREGFGENVGNHLMSGNIL